METAIRIDDVSNSGEADAISSTSYYVLTIAYKFTVGKRNAQTHTSEANIVFFWIIEIQIRSSLEKNCAEMENKKKTYLYCRR